jgi:hypothetical protein
MKFNVLFLSIAPLLLFPGCSRTINPAPMKTDSLCKTAIAQPHELKPANSTEEGELFIYEKASSIGTVAKREFRDDQGRNFKTVYYYPPEMAMKIPYSPESLRPESIVIREYDDHNRVCREKHYSPGMIVRRIMDTVYHDSSKTIVWRRPDETREYEIRNNPNESHSHLYFDCTGNNLIGIRGPMQPDIDLVGGWGSSTEGLSCGIAMSCPRGSLKNMEVNISIRNLTEKPVYIVSALHYFIIQIEIRDSQGNLIPQDKALISEKTRYLLETNRGTNENIQTIPPLESMVNGGMYSLREWWYSHLSAGKYSLTIKRRSTGKDYNLISNTIQFEIIDE